MFVVLKGFGSINTIFFIDKRLLEGAAVIGSRCCGYPALNEN